MFDKEDDVKLCYVKGEYGGGVVTATSCEKGKLHFDYRDE